MKEPFFTLYFSYVGDTECPRIFHRWTAISIVGALLGRSTFLPFGHSEIFPNIYTMLMGQPGTRKSTAIKIGQKLLKAIDYDHFAADRTSKEALWIDMDNEQQKNMEAYLDDGTELEDLEIQVPTELYIVADEFNDFMGIKNEEFQTALTKMWDCPPDYRTRAKNSANTSIFKPTINILGGNTPGGLSKGFGVEAINSGFFSRIIFVHAEPTGVQIPFPESPPGDIKLQMLNRLRNIRDSMHGPVVLTKPVKSLLANIYKGFPGILDRRFNYYQTRRHTNLLKLCIVMAAMRSSLELTEEDVITANTILHVTELQMPQAFGEFGLAKHAEVSNTVIEIIKEGTRRGKPVDAHAIWRQVHQDLNDQKDLSQILSSLLKADKVQQIRMGIRPGFMLKIKHNTKWADGLVDYSTLTEEERIGEHSNEGEVSKGNSSTGGDSVQ